METSTIPKQQVVIFGNTQNKTPGFVSPGVQPVLNCETPIMHEPVYSLGIACILLA